MASKSRSIWISAVLWFCLLVLGCAPAPRFYLQYGNRISEQELESLLAANPLGASENIKAVTLGQTREVSHHVVQVRDREAPHIHKNHDVTVVMLRGQGYLMWEKERVDLVAGDVLFIPRGAVHYFVNTHSGPTVALAIYSPAFDGKDTIPVEKP